MVDNTQNSWYFNVGTQKQVNQSRCPYGSYQVPTAFPAVLQRTSARSCAIGSFVPTPLFWQKPNLITR